MKIAIALLDFNLSRGGAETYARNLARQLVMRGHEVHILSNRWQDAPYPFVFHKVPVVGRVRFLKDLTFAINSKRAMAKLDADVVLSFGRTLRSHLYVPHGGVHKAWYYRDLASLDNLFIKYWKRATRYLSIKHRLILLVEKRQFSRGSAESYVAVSNRVRDDMLKYYSVPPEKISVVYNGGEAGRFSAEPRRREEVRGRVRRSLGIGRDDIVLLFMAHNFRLKGLRYMIEALHRIKGRGQGSFKAIIAGRGDRSPYLKLARRLSVEKDVVFVGDVPDVESYYFASDIFVHPTFFDACSLVCLEALASGLPVITTVFSGAGELISDGVEGFVIKDPRDVDALAEKILHFADETVRAAAFQVSTRLASQYSIENNVSKMLKLIEEIVERKVSPETAQVRREP